MLLDTHPPLHPHDTHAPWHPHTLIHLTPQHTQAHAHQISTRLCTTQRSNADNYDAEIFDDIDMYHQLLRDLISARSRFSEGDDPTEMARAWLEVQKLRTKVKRKVDTKASKGRKIRCVCCARVCVCVRRTEGVNKNAST